MSNVLSRFAPSAHQIERSGLGYSRPLDNDELARIAPSIFAHGKHGSRSDRYSFIPTFDLVDAMREEGFLPTKVVQCASRLADRKGFGKHMIRFRREDQLQAAEAREVVLVNSHDGSSGFQLFAGVFRLICANGLIIGNTDSEIRVRHSGQAIEKVIEGSYSIVNNFDEVTEKIEGLKSVNLLPEQKIAFGKAALALKYDDVDNCGIRPDQVLRPRRSEDYGKDLWSTFNCVQENLLKGGLHGSKLDANGARKRIGTREVKGIDSNVALNRGLWTLAEEMRKLVA